MAQTGKNVRVAYKLEGTFNTAPGDTGAEQLRWSPSPGLAMERAQIQSPEVRSDGLRSMGRLGSRRVPGSFTCPLSVGTFDTLLEAALRSTWVAAVAIDQTNLTSITTTTSTIVAASGSWITEGVRVGDVVRLSGHQTAANNDINLRVTAVSASTITVAGTPLTTDASPDTTFTLTVQKKLANATTPTRRSFYWEEYFQDLDQSVVFGGVRVVGMTIRGQPDGTATVEFRLLGASQSDLDTGSSPYFTSPTLTTSIELVFTDATVRFAGSDIAVATAFELVWGMDADTLAIIGGSTTPDVFDDDANLTGSVDMLRQDLTNLAAYDAETEFELSALLVEPEAEPKDFIHIFVPRLKRTNVSKQLGQPGALIESIPFMGGKKEGVSGYDDTMLTITTSAA